MHQTTNAEVNESLAQRLLSRSMLVLPLAVLGFALCIAGYLIVSKELRYQREGVVVQATVVSKTTRYVQTEEQGAVKSYEIDYQFLSPQGQMIHGLGNVGGLIGLNLKEGDALEVQYLPDDPASSNRVFGSGNWTLGIVLLSIGGVFLLVGLVAGGSGRGRRGVIGGS